MRVTEYSDLATSPQIEYLVLACKEEGNWSPHQHRLCDTLAALCVPNSHRYTRYFADALNLHIPDAGGTSCPVRLKP